MSSDKYNEMLEDAVDAMGRLQTSSTAAYPDEDLALLTAARSGNVNAINWSLVQRTDIDVQDAQKRTAMHHAALAGHIHIIHILHGREANVLLHDEDGATPLHLAIRRNNIACAQLLASLINEKSVELKDIHGLTALHLAIRLGDSRGTDNLVLVRDLLSKGADPNTRSCTGRPAVEEASRLHDGQIFDAIKQHGGKVAYERAPRDRQWSVLRAFMTQTFADPDAQSMDVRMHAHSTLVKAGNQNRSGNYGPVLYWNIHDCIAEHANEIACTAKGIPADDLCRFYCREWLRFEKAVKIHSHCFEFLDRHWIRQCVDDGEKDIRFSAELHHVLWKERFIHAHEQALMVAFYSLFHAATAGDAGSSRQKEIISVSFQAKGIDLETASLAS